MVPLWNSFTVISSHVLLTCFVFQPHIETSMAPHIQTPCQSYFMPNLAWAYWSYRIYDIYEHMYIEFLNQSIILSRIALSWTWLVEEIRKYSILKFEWIRPANAPRRDRSIIQNYDAENREWWSATCLRTHGKSRHWNHVALYQVYQSYVNSAAICAFTASVQHPIHLEACILSLANLHDHQT